MIRYKIPAIKKIISSLTLAWFGFIVPMAARAVPDTGLGTAAGVAQLPTGDNINLPLVIGQILFGVIGFIGVIFLVLTVYGGFLWMTAGGNQSQIQKAGAIMKNGFIGIVIILASFAIVSFVIDLILTSTGT